MTVPALLAELQARDIRVWADEKGLRCNAPHGVLTSELREQLQRHKNDILEFLRNAGALAREQRAIVPLQPRGTRTPIFAIGGHNGDVFCYRSLAKELGGEQPFYGLHPPGLDGSSEPLARVEDLAEYFAANITAFRPEGPYIIGGYCAGGTIAFELAHQLVQRGAQVSLLALFGCPYSTWYRRVPQLRYRLKTLARQPFKHARALASRSWNSRVLYISEELNRRKVRLRTTNAMEADAVLIRRAQVEQRTVAAVRQYLPRFFAGRVAVFLPNKEWAQCGAAPLRWRLSAQCVEEYFGPPGCGVDSMLQEPFSSVFAALFNQCRNGL